MSTFDSIVAAFMERNANRAVSFGAITHSTGHSTGAIDFNGGPYAQNEDNTPGTRVPITSRANTITLDGELVTLEDLPAALDALVSEHNPKPVVETLNITEFGPTEGSSKPRKIGAGALDPEV